jgi:thiol-disulfide isomerase/thioredoxin
MRTPRFALLPAALAVVLALTVGCSSSTAGDTAADAGFVAGDGSIVVLAEDDRLPAPDLVGTTLDGTEFRLADHLGEVVVLNVWASWCAPCRAEAPALRAVAEGYEGDPVQFVGLGTRDSDTSARAFVETFGLTYPSVIDRDGRLQLLFRDSLPPQSIPSTVIIDPQGRVAARGLGTLSEATLRSLIDPLLPTNASGSTGPTG